MNLKDPYGIFVITGCSLNQVPEPLVVPGRLRPDLTDFGQGLPFLHRVACAYAEGGNRAGGGSVDDGVHLHGFQSHDLVAGLDGGTGGYIQGDDRRQAGWECLRRRRRQERVRGPEQGPQRERKLRGPGRELLREREPPSWRRPGPGVLRIRQIPCRQR